MRSSYKIQDFGHGSVARSVFAFEILTQGCRASGPWAPVLQGQGPEAHWPKNYYFKMRSSYQSMDLVP